MIHEDKILFFIEIVCNAWNAIAAVFVSWKKYPLPLVVRNEMGHSPQLFKRKMGCMTSRFLCLYTHLHSIALFKNFHSPINIAWYAMCLIAKSKKDDLCNWSNEKGTTAYLHMMRQNYEISQTHTLLTHVNIKEEKHNKIWSALWDWHTWRSFHQYFAEFLVYHLNSLTLAFLILIIGPAFLAVIIACMWNIAESADKKM